MNAEMSTPVTDGMVMRDTGTLETAGIGIW
jgi:hypothetical protein